MPEHHVKIRGTTKLESYHMSFVETKFTDAAHDFDYVTIYNEQTSSIIIRATHNREFLEWNKTITQSLTESRSENIKVILTPKNLHRIFSDYSKGTLPESYKVILPENYKFDDAPLPIEIQSTMAYQEDSDIKIIALEPVNIPADRRFELKLTQRDKQIDGLIAQVDHLTQLVTSSSNTDGSVNTLALCEKLNTRLDEVTTKFEALGNNVNVNTEISAKVEQLSATVGEVAASIKNVYNKKESDAKYPPVNTSYSIKQSDDMHASRAPKDTTYTKAEVDALLAKYTPLGTAYTKAESDNKYTPNGTAYTKAESDNKYTPNGTGYTKEEANTKFAEKVATV